MEKTPKSEDGTIDKETVKAWYFESPHVAWTPFAKSKGLDPTRSRTTFPYKSWVDEKRDILQQKMAESLSESLDAIQETWQQNVLETLRDYPIACDKMMAILNIKIDQLMHQPGDKSGGSASEIAALSKALHSIVSTKHKALLLNDFVQDATNTLSALRAKVDGAPVKRGLLIHVKGFPEGISPEDWQKMCDEYLDKPIVSPSLDNP